jgi:transcriptional regulator with XRE-family HTH domain
MDRVIVAREVRNATRFEAPLSGPNERISAVRPTGEPQTSVLAIRLRQYRAAHRMSQETFGRAFGVRAATVGRWENGAEPQRRFWAAIAEQLSLDGERAVGALASTAASAANVLALPRWAAANDSRSQVSAPHDAALGAPPDARERVMRLVVDLLEEDRSETNKDLALRLLRELDT